MPIVREGWLSKKKDKVLTGWKQRYCIVRDRKLEYYSEPKGKMLGSIDLSVCRVDEAAHVRNKPYCFALKTSQGNYYFDAHTDQEKAEWLRCLSSCTATSKPNRTSTKNYIKYTKTTSAAQASKQDGQKLGLPNQVSYPPAGSTSAGYVNQLQPPSTLTSSHSFAGASPAMTGGYPRQQAASTAAAVTLAVPQQPHYPTAASYAPAPRPLSCPQAQYQYPTSGGSFVAQPVGAYTSYPTSAPAQHSQYAPTYNQPYMQPATASTASYYTSTSSYSVHYPPQQPFSAQYPYSSQNAYSSQSLPPQPQSSGAFTQTGTQMGFHPVNS